MEFMPFLKQVVQAAKDAAEAIEKSGDAELQPFAQQIRESLEPQPIAGFVGADLTQRGYDLRELDSVEEIFHEWLCWHGILNWERPILRAVDSIIGFKGGKL